MPCGLVTSNLNLKPGKYLRVQGKVVPNTKSFMLNLGKDNNNLCLHLKAHFNTIMCNSRDGGAWSAEQWEMTFPFLLGSVTEMCISSDQTDLSIKLPDGYTFKFPNRLNVETLNFLKADGNFKIKCMALD